MRQIMTRSAQKKLAQEPPVTRRTISKQAKPSPEQKTQAKRSPGLKAPSASPKSPINSKSIAAKSQSKKVVNQLKLTSNNTKTSTNKLRS